MQCYWCFLKVSWHALTVNSGMCVSVSAGNQGCTHSDVKLNTHCLLSNSNTTKNQQCEREETEMST